MGSKRKHSRSRVAFRGKGSAGRVFRLDAERKSNLGFYSDYLNQPLAHNMDLLNAARKEQLRAISTLRGGTDVLVFAADLGKEVPGLPTGIGYVDILPVTDQLSNLQGKKLDLILETPGGLGEVAEDIVRLIRSRYERFSVIVPGWAKSAGTIIAMAADEILMGPSSGLGPIDAQLYWQGKRFSAGALLEGMKKIKDEITSTGVLNRAYIPILQGISPGELQSAQNSLDFSTTLVTQWLVEYKFKAWTTHSSTGEPVTSDERLERAREIARQLCDHSRWLTHGRSIKIEDLRSLRLEVVDYSTDTQLSDAIGRYYALMQMAFSTNMYKIYETAESQIMKFFAPQVGIAPQQVQSAEQAIIEVKCAKCGAVVKLQANLGRAKPIQPGCQPFPPKNRFRCPSCGTESDLSDLKRQIEAQTKKTVV
jgi:hypothetical protein